MFIGLIIIIIGIAFLLQNLGYISGVAWNIIWPAILIVIGIAILLKKRNHGFFWEEKFGWGKKQIKEKLKKNR